MINIAPIRLLKGCHKETARTGSGCFLNVCSYLQGDETITDKPSSVSAALRPIFIVLNDLVPTDALRQKLLPFVHRAMLTGQEDSNANMERAYRVLERLIEDRWINDGLMSQALNQFHNERSAGEATRGAIAQALQRAGTRMVTIWPKSLLSVEDFEVTKPSGHYISVKNMCAWDAVFEAVIETLDEVLPQDHAPEPKVAARAVNLVQAREAWGDKPVPAPSMLNQDYVAMQFLAGLDDDFLKSQMLKELMAIKQLPLAVSSFEKPNKPHGPLKKHKPCYF